MHKLISNTIVSMMSIMKITMSILITLKIKHYPPELKELGN